MLRIVIDILLIYWGLIIVFEERKMLENTMVSNKKKNESIIKALISIVIIAFFAFGDYSIYVYAVKVISIIGLLFYSRALSINSYLRWISLFFILCFSSIIWASDKDIVLAYIIWYLQAVLIAYSIGNTIKDEADIEFILKCIMVGGLILALRSFQGVSFSELGSFRLGKNIGYNANEMALKTALGSIIAFRYFRESIKKNIKIIYFLIMFVQLVSLLFTESRKGIIMVFGTMFLYSILCSQNPIKLIKNTCLAISGLIIIYLLMTKIQFLYDAFGRRFLLLLNILDDNAYVGNSLGNRIYAVQLGLNAFKEKPIFGYGLGNFMTATGLNGYAHNNYIQLLVDLGLLGLSLYYSVYIINIWGLIKTIRVNRGLTALLLSMLLTVTLIEYGLVSFNSDYVQLVIMLCYFIVQINHKKIKFETNSIAGAEKISKISINTAPKEKKQEKVNGELINA